MATQLHGELGMGKFGTGQAIRRSEDQRFLTGKGEYTDDITLDNQAYLYILRSPYAHGVISSLDVTDARSASGVIAVYTADDLDAAGIRDVIGSGIPKSSLTPEREALRQPPLARERVRYVGEPVAAVVAESVSAARDAAELIWFEVEDLDAVVTPTQALRDNASQVHESVAKNSYGILEYGDQQRTDDAFASATHTVEIEVVNNRLAPTAMEPRGCNISYDGEELTVYQGCQGVHALRDRLAESFDLGSEQIHVISPDVGGAFGLLMVTIEEGIDVLTSAHAIEELIQA